MIYISLTLSEKNKRLILVSTNPKLVIDTHNNFIDAVNRSGCPDSFNISIKSYSENGEAYSTILTDLRTEDITDIETTYVATIKMLCAAKCDILGATETNDSKTLHFKYDVS